MYIAREERSISSAILRARDLIESGAALSRLEQYIEMSNAMGQAK